MARQRVRRRSKVARRSRVARRSNKRGGASRRGSQQPGEPEQPVSRLHEGLVALKLKSEQRHKEVKANQTVMGTQIAEILEAVKSLSQQIAGNENLSKARAETILKQLTIMDTK